MVPISPSRRPLSFALSCLLVSMKEGHIQRHFHFLPTKSSNAFNVCFQLPPSLPGSWGAPSLSPSPDPDCPERNNSLFLHSFPPPTQKKYSEPSQPSSYPFANFRGHVLALPPFLSERATHRQSHFNRLVTLSAPPSSARDR